jgi:DNA modification methylase
VIPYYDEDGITIYHGDCLSLLTNLPSPELVLTDPPYGIGYDLPGRDNHAGSGTQRARRGFHAPIRGDMTPFDPAPWIGQPAVLFGANHYSDRLPVGGWLVWDKSGGGRAPVTSFAGIELAWTNATRRVSMFAHLWTGYLRDTEVSSGSLHPNQKPVALMRWILERWSSPGDLILDPYMGSGPIAQACKEMGRRYVGIEIEERYCEIAVQRLAQGVLEFS